VTADASSNYSLWKLTGSYKRQATPKFPIKTEDGTWARSTQDRVEAFAQSLEDRFTPFGTASVRRQQIVADKLAITHQMELPVPPITVQEVKEDIKKLNVKKAPGDDQIDNRIARTLPLRALLYLILIFNASLRLSYFPKAWKSARIVMILKPGKPPEDLNIPQGSVLRPTLYSLFTHDMPKSTGHDHNSMLATFADDTAVLSRSNCIYDATDMLQLYLKRFENWACRWNISINPAKCAVVTHS
ncbi:hypothetical protein KR200_006487, partial [Drosophila serrata]